jgi:hypothetical protein
VGIVLTLKERHRIIRVPQDRTVAAAVPRDDCGKPLVQDRIQEHIGDHWRHDGALRASQFILHHTTWGLDPSFEHPRDQPQKLRVSDPLCQHSEDLLMWHGVEKLGEIQIHDPVDRLPHDLIVEPA